MLFLILSRLFYLQVITGERLQEKAIDQWTREIPVVAERGEFYDRNGKLIVSNYDAYTVYARANAISDKETTAKILSESFSLDYQVFLNKLRKSSVSEITVARQVSQETINTILTNELKGVYYSRDNARYYEHGDFLSQVLGFTSVDGNGLTGLELYYNKYLKGQNGEILTETDIIGKEINGKNSYIPASDGLNVMLTIDFEIQLILEDVLSRAIEEHGAKTAEVIVVDPNTGEILGMCMKPSFNLNEIPRDNKDLLNALSRNVLITDVYEPGSTFKIITVAANIEEYLKGNSNAYSPSHIFNSSRYRYIDGQKVKCWSDHKNGKHANLNISGGLNNSCNPIFVDMAMSLGKEKMYEYITKFNFGKATGIDFVGESQGMILPVSSVQNVDLARIGFGQTIAVTPIQLALATAAVINGGNYYSPYLVKALYSSDNKLVERKMPILRNKVISKEASKILNEMLMDVVVSGSGNKAYIEGYNVAGKTGTAQKYENGVIASGKYVSSFIGYFPSNAPKYLALVIVDEPKGQYYGSTVAAPYAREIFERIIEVKQIKPVS